MMQMSSAIAGDVRQELADLLPRLAMLRELELRPKALNSFAPCSCAIGCPLVNDSGIGWPSISASFGLWIERFEMRRPARHVEKDHPFHLGGMMQRMDRPAYRRGNGDSRLHETRERNTSQADAGLGEECATGDAGGDGIEHGETSFAEVKVS